MTGSAGRRQARESLRDGDFDEACDCVYTLALGTDLQPIFRANVTLTDGCEVPRRPGAALVLPSETGQQKSCSAVFETTCPKTWLEVLMLRCLPACTGIIALGLLLQLESARGTTAFPRIWKGKWQACNQSCGSGFKERTQLCEAEPGRLTDMFQCSNLLRPAPFAKCRYAIVLCAPASIMPLSNAAGGALHLV